MSNAVTKYHYISELEYNNLQAFYRAKSKENHRLLAEVKRLNHVIEQLNVDVISANESATKYREMYQALREGKYLLIPK